MSNTSTCQCNELTLSGVHRLCSVSGHVVKCSGLLKRLIKSIAAVCAWICPLISQCCLFVVVQFLVLLHYSGMMKSDLKCQASHGNTIGGRHSRYKRVRWIECVAFGYRKAILYDITSSTLSFVVHACKHFDMSEIVRVSVHLRHFCFSSNHIPTLNVQCTNL